jgi:hypothetical protein
MYGSQQKKLLLALAIAAPMALVGCGGGSSDSASSGSENPIDNGGGEMMPDPTPGPSPSGVAFAVMAEGSATESCAAVDVKVAIHDQNGTLLRTLSPTTDGGVDLGSLSPTDFVTVFDETSQTVRAVSIKADIVPDEIAWTLSQYEGATGECFTENDDDASFEAVVSNADEFASIEIGPSAKFLSSSASTPDRATMMADQQYRVLAGGYDSDGSMGNRRLTDYALTGLVQPGEGDSVNLTIATGTTPYAISLDSTTRSLSTAWVDPDTSFSYELEELEVTDTNRDGITSINAIETGKGSLQIRHMHRASDFSSGLATVVETELFENTDSIVLSTPDLTALTNVSYSSGEVSYQLTETVADSERIQELSVAVAGYGFDETKNYYHTVFTNEATGSQRVPDLSSLISGNVAAIQNTSVLARITGNGPSIFDYTFAGQGMFGLGSIPESYGYSTLFGPSRMISNSHVAF